MDIQFTVRCAAGVSTSISRPVNIALRYNKSIIDEDGTPQEVQGSATITLDATFSGDILLQGAANGIVEASVLMDDGAALIVRSLTAVAGAISMELSSADVTLINSGGQQLLNAQPQQYVTRSARLITTGPEMLITSTYDIVICPVNDMTAYTATGLERILNCQGTRMTVVEVTGQNIPELSRLPWTAAHFAVDGTFTFNALRQPTIGWIWWMSGPNRVLGFVPLDLNIADERIFAIALPQLGAPKGLVPVTDDSDCDCHNVVPRDVTESELANNPDVYTEDPGSFCKPFSNPERVLSERSFKVIARVTTPEIGALGSVNTRTMKLLNLDGDNGNTGTTSSSGSTGGRFGSLFPSGTGSTAVGKAIAAATSRVKPIAQYIDLLKQLPTGRGKMTATNPLQWEDDIAQYQSSTVAKGHILEFRMRWRSNGYSLGTVAKTLTLAPRQTKRIQKIEWERSERARRTERTQLTDQESDSNTRELDYQDNVAANLSEWASGSSHSDTEAIAGGIGFFAAGILGGIGGGAGSANSSSQQQGGRDTTASERQRLHDAIRRHGDALRKFESTVVSEVSQEENVTGTTEVIRNANFMHSLTVIYHQILRHLKVNTEFAGVRECLYIPFAIKPFDVDRAYRWREAIQASIRSQRFGRALRYLKDVASGFAFSDIPTGQRAAQPVTYLRGSIHVSLGIERPRDTADGLFNEPAWQVAFPLLGSPAFGIFSSLAAVSEAQRDRSFQAEHAPTMAANWANKLRLLVGGLDLMADMTLATRYQFNRTVRIDFTVPESRLSGLTREGMQSIRVVAGNAMPPGSVANLTGMTVTYDTARYERGVRGLTGTNDLVNPVNGNIDTAQVALPLDPWERVDERAEITRAVGELVEHLNEHVEYYHKAIWWRMDRDRLLMMLDGFFVPDTLNVSIASVVDREPIGVIGNCLIYRVGAASFLGNGNIDSPEKLYNLYADNRPMSDPVLISLPTDGLYAQTIMDECLALEEHFGNTDWVLNDKEPELGSIDASLLTSRRADSTTTTTPTAFPGTIINLQNAPDAPAPQGLAGVLGAVTNANAFRDMAGLAGTQANALASFKTAAELATNFGNQAAALELAKMAKADQATRTADQKLASINRARESGLTTDAEAAQQARGVLSAMNPDTPNAEAPHQNPAINAAINSARTVPGSTIAANTAEGGVSVTMGGGTETAEDRGTAHFIIEDPTTHTAENRAFNPNASDERIRNSGRITLAVRVPSLPTGGDVRWSIPPDQAGHYTLAGGRNVQFGLRAEITGLQPGLTNIDVEVRDASGTVVESQKYPLCVPQFITVDQDAATFVPVMTAFGLIDAENEEVMREAKAVVDTVLSRANIRTIWRMAPFAQALPAQFAAGGAGAANVTKAIFMGNDPSGRHLYGLTKDRLGSSNPTALIGPDHFDETVEVYPGSFSLLVPPGTSNADVDDMTNAIIHAIAAIGPVSSVDKTKATQALGRLYGETLAHEIGHTLIGSHLSSGYHNTSPGFEADLMNFGPDRSFERRTGFVVDATLIGTADIATLLGNDRGIFFIDIPTTDAQNHIDASFPVPGIFQ